MEHLLRFDGSISKKDKTETLGRSLPSESHTGYRKGVWRLEEGDKRASEKEDAFKKRQAEMSGTLRVLLKKGTPRKA